MIPWGGQDVKLQDLSKNYLWAHKELDLAPHPVAVLVLQVGDAKKFPPVLGFDSLDLFSESACRVHISQP